MKTRASASSGSAAPRLTRPGDAAEREADRLAEDALSRTPPATLRPLVTEPAGTIMRQVSDERRREPEYEEEDGYDLAAKSRSATTPAPPAGFLDSVRSSPAGRPLDAGVRSRMERGFGRPLDSVRTHADGASAGLSDAIGARAFTHGRDIFFAGGEYAPGTDGGDRLLAHELAHTLQHAPPGRVARQPKPKPGATKPAAKDPSRMTDREKIKRRAELRDQARAEVAAYKAQFDKNPVVDAAALAAVKQALADALAKAETIANQDQKAERVAWLKAEIRLLDDPFYAWLRARRTLWWSGGLSVVEYVGDPANELGPAELAALRRHVALVNAGGLAYALQAAEAGEYAKSGLTSEDLATPEQSKAEAGAGGTGAAGTGAAGTTAPTSADAATGAFDPAGTFEDRVILEELHAALADLVTTGAVTYDQAALLAELGKLPEDVRKDFYAFARSMAQPLAGGPGARAPKTLDDLLQLFKRLDPASREALKVNRETAEADPTAGEAMPESVRLDLGHQLTAQKSVEEKAQRIQGDLARIRAKAMPKEVADKVAKELGGLDLGITPFLNESAMLYGLLAGGSRSSPLVQQASDELLVAVYEFRDNIEREMTETLVESAVLVGISAATKVGWLIFGLRIARLAKRLKQLKQLVDTLNRIYATADRIGRLIRVIEQVRAAYPTLKSWYDTASAEYARFQRVLASEDADETIEAALEAKEDELIEKLDGMLEGTLGDLLEMLYIPDDATPDELRAILFDIPRGITAFEEMWGYYRGPEEGKPHFADVLSVKAYHAGRLLSPFVGFVSAHVATALQRAPEFAARGFKFSINRRISGALATPDRGKKTRRMFGGLNRKKYVIKPGALDTPANDAQKMLQRAISAREPGDGAAEHWSPAWFKRVMRDEIKTVNDFFKKETVEATPKGAPKGTAPERIPMPKFRVRLHRPSRWAKKLTATLTVNPDRPIEVDRLGPEDFAGEGIVFIGDEQRKEGIRKFLRENEYDVVPHPSGTGEYIRLRGGLTGTAEHPYLRIVDGKIKSGAIPKDGHTPFIDRVIADERDLPEGYHFVESKAGVNVALKRGLAALNYTQLGLGDGRKLVVGPGKAAATGVAPLNLKPVTKESYDYVKAVDAMFAPTKPGVSPFKAQRTKPQWLDLMQREEDLRKRPRALEGRLGYTIRARALGDRLASRYLPELRGEDDKGHLIARRFGSDVTDPYWNLLPTLRRKNQFPGEWFDMESKMAEVYVGKNATGTDYVEFGLSLVYPSNETRRPSKFIAKYQAFNAQGTSIGGGEKRKTVEND